MAGANTTVIADENTVSVSKMNYTLEGMEDRKTCGTDKQSSNSIQGELSRGRLNSINHYNTPILSPLKFFQSPYSAQPNLFDAQLNMMQQDFKLEEPINEDRFARVQESEEQSVSQMDFPVFDPDTRLTKDNMIDFLVECTNTNEQRIQQAKQALQKSNQSYLHEVFQYLYRRFKKSKKTKEEMIKYTMRKSFKFITDELKREDPSLIPMLATDGLEGMTIYFSKHCSDNDIAIPFKKNSFEKTMNTAFLKKVFACQRFYSDYKRFLKTFQTEFLKDNKKKITSMNDAVKSCLTSKSFKNLENYKRLPWTKEILIKLKTFAQDLLSYSPQKNSLSRVQIVATREDGYEKNCGIDIFNEHQIEKPPNRKQSDFHFDQEQEQQQLPSRVIRKQVIILSPFMSCLSPPKIPQIQPHDHH